jgi:hypothetical protein
MSDDDQEARNKKTLEAYSRSIKDGTPIMSFEAHRITKFSESLAGEVLIDFVFAATLDGQPTVARLTLTAEAARTLKAHLVASENIPDTPPPAIDPQSMH